jgi:urease accessory protein
MAPMTAQLLLLLDSRAPAGAHSHSGGLEAAVSAGLVRDLDDVSEFCAGRLRTAGVVAAAFAAAAAELWQTEAPPERWLVLDEELSARTPAPALRVASRALGSGLWRLLRAVHPEADAGRRWNLVERPAPHHPLVLGAACAIAGSDPETAARAAALGVCSTVGSAAVRLLSLDPYQVQAVLGRLGPEVDRIALSANEIRHRDPSNLPAGSAPALELLAEVHARSEVRLFAS